MTALPLLLDHCTVGDSFEIVPRLADGSFDAVVTDHPYGVGVDTWDAAAPNHLLTEYLRIARGVVVLFGAAPRIAADLAEFDPKPDRILIWAPSFTNSHTQSKKVFFRYHPIYVWRIPDIHHGPPHDVLRTPTDSQREHVPWYHPCTKPAPLMAELCGFVPEGGTILDPFGGSGSTAVGALRRGRHASLIELDPDHAATANGRIAAELAGHSYAAHRAGQRPLFDIGKGQRRRRQP